MHIILLSGGSGKRLWPLSNEVRSKQFLKIFQTDAGRESMVQRVYRQIKTVIPDASVTIATSKAQVSAIRSQLGEKAAICVEPCRRDTLAAIALAAAYLHQVKGVGREEAVVVCPVDPYVEEDYFRCVYALYEAAKKGERRLTLMGIRPSYPSEKYGYIKPEPGDGERIRYRFTEKPVREEAEEYIKEGALWNGGVFACRLSYVLEKSHKLLGTQDYGELLRSYDRLPKISFDYAVAEQETSIQVIRYDGMWKDLGTWNTLTEAMDESILGDGRTNETCSDVHILNELNVPILAMGLHDVIISASPEGILVSDKEQSSYIKPFVEEIVRPVMFAEKSWGSFRVLDVEEESLTIKVTLRPGHAMNYHSHERRDEVWTVISGRGKAVVDGMERPVGAGDVVMMRAGCKHTVMAETELKLIEVQLGRDITVSDKRKYEL